MTQHTASNSKKFFESDGQQISASIEAQGNEQIITCSFRFGPVDLSTERTETFTWVNGEGWENGETDAWSPILEKLFELK